MNALAVESTSENSPKRILLVEDDEPLREELAEYLSQQGFEVDTMPDGRQLFETVSRLSYDLIVLDLMIPGQDGMTLTREVRAKSNVPIIIITGKSDVVDRIIGLEIGADDYINKPFDFRELQARIKAIFRRNHYSPGPSARASTSRWRFDGWTVDGPSRNLQAPDGTYVDLTTAEYMLLEAFLKNPNQMMTREALLEYVHNRRWSPLDRSIDNLVARLRKKLARHHKGPSLIKTVRSRGYMFTPSGELEETEVG